MEEPARHPRVTRLAVVAAPSADAPNQGSARRHYGGSMQSDAQRGTPTSGSANESKSRQRLVVGMLSLAVAVVIAALLVRWWKRGGPRRAVKALAEHEAVRVADRLVDEILPAA
jgi:hypothetical protein